MKYMTNIQEVSQDGSVIFNIYHSIEAEYEADAFVIKLQEMLERSDLYYQYYTGFESFV
jgi:hypothetical protein